MNPILLPNRELENYAEQDDFNFLTKADAIKIFLEQNPSALKKNKMLVLYGDWGSGKTSLMRHIEHTLNSNIYKTIFFQAWEHEKDENLALSLCDALTESIGEKFSHVVKDFMKGALLTLKAFTSGVTLKLPAFLSGIGMDLEISGEKYIKAFNDAIDKTPNPSFYKSNKEFKEKFIAIENLVLKEHNAQKILVFVDDLDRCEPENVLNLITALKLFFTYGENTIFLCGIDKEAVTKAVKTKYKDVVKSEEYMEKVFDISFNMPRIFSLNKMIKPHIKGSIKLLSGHTISNADLVEDFLRYVRFTNPRHLKKVLSKYEIIKSFKALSTIPEDIRKLIPNIIEDDGEQNLKGNIFETIFCLFIIILHEFHYKDYVEIECYEEKIQKYIEPFLKSSTSGHNLPGTYQKSASHVNNNLTIKNHKDFILKQLDKTLYKNPDSHLFTKFVLMFSHGHPEYLTDFSDTEIQVFKDSFSDNEFLTLFCKFIIKYKNDIIHSATDYPIWNMFQMVNYLL